MLKTFVNYTKRDKEEREKKAFSGFDDSINRTHPLAPIYQQENRSFPVILKFWEKKELERIEELAEAESEKVKQFGAE